MLFVQCVYLPTIQAETYLKIYVLNLGVPFNIDFSSLFGRSADRILKENVIFELVLCASWLVFTDLACSKNNVSSVGK